MLEIQTDKRVAYVDVDMSFDTMLQIMKDDFIKDDEFIELTFIGGEKGALMKKHVIGFSEVEQEVF